MTLKSFYSCNHRLPLTWIRAVTPAPACLPPRLPKLPAGRQADGEAAQLLPGRAGERKDLEGETQKDRLEDRDTERERNAATSHQEQTWIKALRAQICPGSRSHFHNSDTPLWEHRPLPDLQAYTNTQILTNHKYTLYKIPSIRNSEYTNSRIHRDT